MHNYWNHIRFSYKKLKLVSKPHGNYHPITGGIQWSITDPKHILCHSACFIKSDWLIATTLRVIAWKCLTWVISRRWWTSKCITSDLSTLDKHVNKSQGCNHVVSLEMMVNRTTVISCSTTHLWAPWPQKHHSNSTSLVLCEKNPPVTGGFPQQSANNVEIVFHVMTALCSTTGQTICLK